MSKKAERETETRKILLVEDHPIMRQGVAMLIEGEEDLEVCGEAEEAHGALEAIEREMPDLVLVDISLKDSSGLELIKDLHIRYPDLPALVLSMHNESFYAERVLHAGAKGYVTKAEASGKVLEAIRKVLAGGVYVSEQIATKMLSRMVPGGDSTTPPVDRLSDREFQVFEMIGQGLQMREIADQLHLSIKTVEAHREHIKRKLATESAADLLRYAVQWYQSERQA